MPQPITQLDVSKAEQAHTRAHAIFTAMMRGVSSILHNCNTFTPTDGEVISLGLDWAFDDYEKAREAYQAALEAYHTPHT
jgi:hypothetical protein